MTKLLITYVLIISSGRLRICDGIPVPTKKLLKVSEKLLQLWFSKWYASPLKKK